MRIPRDTTDHRNLLVRWQAMPAGSDSDRGLQRSGLLTPYVAEIMMDDALRVGPGGRLEIVMPPRTTDGGIMSVLDRLAWLTMRGVRVTVRREQGAARRAPHAA